MKPLKFSDLANKSYVDKIIKFDTIGSIRLI